MSSLLLPLKWSHLQHFQKLVETDSLHMNTNRSGLYIWGFTDDTNKFWPYYVGKHRNIPFRLCEHLSNLKGGNYTIYKNSDLFSMEDNRFYTPVSLLDRIRFITDSFGENQKAHVENMINRFHYTYCLIDEYHEWGSRSEMTVLNCFSKNLLGNTIFGTHCEEVNVGNLFDVISTEWDIRTKKDSSISSFP